MKLPDPTVAIAVRAQAVVDKMDGFLSAKGPLLEISDLLERIEKVAAYLPSSADRLLFLKLRGAFEGFRAETIEILREEVTLQLTQALTQRTNEVQDAMR